LQLLNVAKTTGTGEGQATAVVEAFHVEDGSLEDHRMGSGAGLARFLSFDTRSSNTLLNAGCCSGEHVLIE